MNKYYYEKPKNIRGIIRVFGLMLAIIGIATVGYIFMPLIIWQFTIAPVYAQQQITAPIPKHILVTGNTLQSLFATSLQTLSGVDLTNAQNWYPGFNGGGSKARVSSYYLTIPKLGIINAAVSTNDSDLSKHLVQLTGTPVAPDPGTTIIFGHSTLPQLYDRNNYKTILANAYQLQTGDYINSTVEGVTYSYKIFSILIVDPTDTSVLAQSYDDSYLTLITCTPPGTVWKRLAIQARLQKLN